MDLSVQSIPRQVSWDPGLEQLLFAPLEEQAQLRGAPLFTAITTPTPLPPVMIGTTSSADGPHGRSRGDGIGGGDSSSSGSSAYILELDLGSWPLTSAGNQSELNVTFMLPPSSAKFGVVVMGSSSSTGAGKDSNLGAGMLFYVDYIPPLKGENIYTVAVGTEPYSSSSSSSNANDKDESIGRSGGNTSGDDVGGTQDVLRMHANESAINIRVFVDNTMAEGYWQGGRVAMSTLLTPTTDSSMAAVATTSSASTVVTLAAAEAWAVGSIWVSTEDVLKEL